MAVSLGNTAVTTAPSAGTQKTATLTVDATSNLVLIFASVASNTTAVTTCDVGGTAGTLVTSGKVSENTGTNGNTLEIWKIATPPTGSQTVTVNWSPSGTVAFGCCAILGSDGTVGTAVTGSATGGSPSVTVSSAVGDMVIDCLIHDLGTTCAASTQVASGAATFSALCTNSAFRLSGQSKDGAASVAMGWTITGGDLTWAQVGVSIHAAAAAAAPILMLGHL